MELFRDQLQCNLVYQTDRFWEHSVSTFPLMTRICVMRKDLLIIFFWLIFFPLKINSVRDSLLFQLDISSVRCLVAGSCSSKSVRPEIFHSDQGTNLFVVECKLLLSANCSPSPVLYALKLLKFRGCLLIRNFIFIIILLMHFISWQICCTV